MILGENQHLSFLTNKLNADKFLDLREEILDFEKSIKNENLKEIFHKCFFNTIDSTVFFENDGSVFIITGDIPAMWLRDSSVQVMQYLFFADKCDSIKTLIKGVLKKQFTFLMQDPYANAFNREPNGMGHAFDLDKQKPIVWERKFELDSLTYPLWLAVKYFEKTNDKSCFDDLFFSAFDVIYQTFKAEQNHHENSKYYHCITSNLNACVQHGTPVAVNGLVWSGYRPSDDLCKYGYYLPGNMFIVAVFTKLQKIFDVLGDNERKAQCESLCSEIQSALSKCCIIKNEKGKLIYALETDGLGNYNIMDDANVPNLLALPYYEYPYIDYEVYQNTRNIMLSFDNPYYYEGKILKGIGSPHTPKNRVWPLSIIIRALTSNDKNEINESVNMLINSTGGTGYMHEAIDKDDDLIYSRPWFAWANSLFSYLILSKKDLIDDII